MKALLLPKWKIASNLWPMLVMLLPLIVILFLPIDYCFIQLFKGSHSLPQAQEMAIPYAVLAMLLLSAGFTFYVIRNYARSRFEVTDGTLFIVGRDHRGKIAVREYALGDINRIVLGQKLPSVANDARKMSDKLGGSPMLWADDILRKGIVQVQHADGPLTVFYFFDRIFEPNSLAAVFSELVEKGVKIVNA